MASGPVPRRGSSTGWTSREPRSWGSRRSAPRPISYRKRCARRTDGTCIWPRPSARGTAAWRCTRDARPRRWRSRWRGPASIARAGFRLLVMAISRSSTATSPTATARTETCRGSPTSCRSTGGSSTSWSRRRRLAGQFWSWATSTPRMRRSTSLGHERTARRAAFVPRSARSWTAGCARGGSTPSAISSRRLSATPGGVSASAFASATSAGGSTTCWLRPEPWSTSPAQRSTPRSWARTIAR